MYKKNKDILKLILLILLIVSIPLIMISIEFMQQLEIISSLTPSEEIKNPLDELYQTIIAEPKNKDSSTIRKCIAEIFTLMNEQNYTKLYALLTDDIKNLLFPTEEEFKVYMETYLKTEKYTPKLYNYEKLNKQENDIFIVKVGFLPYSTSKNDISAQKKSVISDTFTLYLTDSGDYKFSFISYIGASTPDEKFEKDNITFALRSVDLYTSKTTFTIEVSNNGNTDLFIDKNGIYLYTGLMQKSYPESILVPATSSTTISYTIYTGLNLKDSLPKELYFKGVHANEKVYLFALPIEYPIKLSTY